MVAPTLAVIVEMDGMYEIALLVLFIDTKPL